MMRHFDMNSPEGEEKTTLGGATIQGVAIQFEGGATSRGNTVVILWV